MYSTDRDVFVLEAKLDLEGIFSRLEKKGEGCSIKEKMHLRKIWMVDIHDEEINGYCMYGGCRPRAI
jgi:hypothetical protein